jgi:hypothetical protein
MGRLVGVALLVAAAGACGPASLMPDPTGVAGTGGGGGVVGTGGGAGDEPFDLVSDFEDVAVATVVMSGVPPRNGTWYTYNDGTPCTQVPTPLDTTMKYIGQAPPSGVPPGSTGSLALHGYWSGCAIWGAGIGADLYAPLTPDGSIYTGPKVAYDLSSYAGVTFWAMAAPGGSDTELRIKFPMRVATRVEDGGACVESATLKCSDDWGERFSLPANGSWKQFTVKFSDRLFQQEGWGAVFTWNPTDVTSIQIQSVDKGELYDFWIDDIYLIR